MGFRAFGIVTSLLVIIISTDICFAASSNPFMSKPLITSGSVITEGDPITISASLNGEFAVSDLNSVLIYVSSILLQNRMITLTFDILVYEDGLGPDLTDTKLLETSFIHKARFSNIPKQNGVSVELSENQIKKNVFDANELINL
ncbi:MAG: hypothetical protein NTY37_11850, partial [Methanothrix sp.]|nr:hypothetical protein [Methanothrix sp.]